MFYVFSNNKVEMSSRERETYEAHLLEHKSLAQASQVERDKLMELLQVTQRRYPHILLILCLYTIIPYQRNITLRQAKTSGIINIVV